MIARMLRLGLGNVRRDLRAGELTLILVAIVTAVAALSAVSLFVDRAERALAAQGNALLAADLALESANAIPEALAAEARGLGLEVARTLSMRSVLQSGDRLQLTELKAVDDDYPLRGQVSIADAPFDAAREVGEVPAPGTLWADARLLQSLSIEVGQSVTVGAIALRVEKVLVLEPDRGGDFFSIAPRAIMSLADVAATGLVMPGSRVNHRLLVAGEEKAIAALRERWQLLNDRGLKIIDVRDARPEVRTALERADLFLGMAALTAVIVAGVAIALAARRYAERHLDTAAIMRCLGATQATITGMLLTEMMVLASVASIAGVALGYIAQHVLAATLSGFVGGALPPPTLAAVAGAMLIGIIVLVGFALTPILSLKNVPPLRVLRRDLAPVPTRSAIVYAVALIALLAIAPWQARDVALTLYLLGGCLTAIAALALAAWLSVRALGRLRRHVGVSWRYGLASVARRARTSSVQIVALGLGIMAMLLITLVHGDLIAGWQRKIPPGAPNQFVINIPPAEVEPLREFLAAHRLHTGGVFPMIRGRLTAINGRPVQPSDYDDPRARRLVDREFNLSWAGSLQPDNVVIAGAWWPDAAQAAPQFSVESGIAETLGIRLGDTLSYDIVGETITAPVTSLREVQWDSFNVNFFVIAAPGLLEPMPATHITSFHLPTAERTALNELVRRFPSVTVIDVAAVMDQVRSIMDRVNLAVRFVFLFTLLAGALVLVAALQATQDERARESALLRSLGAKRAIVTRSLLAEFIVIGLVAGVLASSAAGLTAWLLAEHVFHVDYRINLWLWPIGTLAGVLGVGAFGLAGLRGALAEPPASVLRRIA
jgi:putative ABC transport system permease protein